MSQPTFDRRLLGLTLLPLAIYVTVYAIIDRARPTGIVFETIEPSQFASVATDEGQLRYFWLSAFVLLTAAALAIAASSALALMRDTPERDRPLVFGLVGIGVVVIVVAEMSGMTDHWYIYLGEGLYSNLFSQITIGSRSALSTLNIGLELTKAATALALLLLVACLIMTLARPRHYYSSE